MEDETLEAPSGEDDQDDTLVRPDAASGPGEEEPTLVGARPMGASSSEAGSKSAQPRLTPGTVLADRYRVVTALGKGGMGEVYRADDLKLEVPVALKFLPPAMEADSEKRAQLLAEVKVAHKISHPNACRVYDLGETDGVYFLSMEYIDGEDLKSLLRRIGRPPWDKSVELGRQMCEGLRAAHEAGVLHRDLKPANLMIDGEGRARLTDFGLAALADSLTGGGALAGTPLYMAPEQFSGTPASVESDLYSLGLVLYELLTGTRAFNAGSLTEAERLHKQAIPTPPSKLRFGFDPAVEEMILRCLAKDPADRPGSVEEVSAVFAGGVGAGFSEGAQIATLVASDLVANAQLVESLGDSGSGELFQLHDRLLRDLVETHGGREIEKSDGFLLLFPRPLEALRFALAYHQKLEELSKEKGVELAARVGVHLGEVVVRRNSARDIERGAKPLEVEGFARPMTGRLMSLAAGRQTLLTQGAFDVARRSARGELDDADALRWLAHGEYVFEVADEPAAVFEVGVAGFAPLAAPGLEVPQQPNWIVERKLGEGGFGEAWLVSHGKSGALPILEALVEEDPTRVSWLRQVAQNHEITSSLHLSQGRTGAAARSLETGIGLLSRIVSITGDDPGPRNLVGWYRLMLGDVHAQAGNRDRARELWTQVVESLEPITASSDVMNFRDTHVQALLRLGRVEESRPLVEDLLARGWSDPGFLELVRQSGLSGGGELDMSDLPEEVIRFEVQKLGYTDQEVENFLARKRDLVDFAKLMERAAVVDLTSAAYDDDDLRSLYPRTFHKPGRRVPDGTEMEVLKALQNVARGVPV